MESKRKAAAGAGAVLAAVLAVAGTWAYSNYIQQGSNEVKGQSNPGVRLHDDFDEANANNKLTLNKDIYVENYGEHDQFVRLKLTEFMEGDGAPVDGSTTSQKFPEGGTDGDKTYTAWHTHLYGDATDVFHQHNWWQLQWGGQKYYLPTDNYDDDPSDGANDPANKAANDTTEYKVDQLGTVGSNGNKIAQTLNAVVVSMADWLAADDDQKKAWASGAWVYDADGWAYWAGPLEPGTATGLLLNGVTLSKKPEFATYWYGVRVVLQAATLDDLAKFATADTFSANAQQVLRYYGNVAPNVVMDQGFQNVTLTAGQVYNGDASVWFEDKNEADTLSFELVAEKTTAAGATVNATTGALQYTSTAGDTGKTLTIAVIVRDALGAASPAVTVTLKITA